MLASRLKIDERKWARKRIKIYLKLKERGGVCVGR